MYRLDAVDDNRGQLGATAYTEVRRDGISLDDGDAGDLPAGRGDAAVAALARAVEAMQRVQSEREKAQAEREKAQNELIARLVERLAPPAPAVAPRNLREVLDEHVDVSKRIEKLAPRSEDGDGDDGSVLEKLQPTIEKVVGLVEMALYRKFGPASNAQAPVADDAEEGQGEEPEPAGKSEGAGEPEEPNAKEKQQKKKWSDAEVARRLNQVEAKLSPAERCAVQIAIQSMTKEVLAEVTEKLMSVSVDQAVAEIRRLLQGGAPPNGKKKANGTSASANNEGSDGLAAD